MVSEVVYIFVLGHFYIWKDVDCNVFLTLIVLLQVYGFLPRHNYRHCDGQRGVWAVFRPLPGWLPHLNRNCLTRPIKSQGMSNQRVLSLSYTFLGKNSYISVGSSSYTNNHLRSISYTGLLRKKFNKLYSLFLIILWNTDKASKFVWVLT